MFSLPSAKKKTEPRCQIKIGKIEFIQGPSKKVEIREIRNVGDAECNMKPFASIRPSTSPTWTEVPISWNPKALQPGATTKITLDFDWTSGTTFFIRIATEKGTVTMAYGKAP